MNLKNRKPVSEMSTQAIERELEKFAWEYIAWADYARSDAQYLEGEEYLNERKASLKAELAERNTSQLTQREPDETWGCPMCDAEFPWFVLSCPCGYPRPSRQ